MNASDVVSELRPITESQALRSYQSLKSSNLPRAGLNTLDRHFLAIRLMTKTSKGRGRVSFLEMLNTDRLLSLVTRYERYKHNPARITNQYNVFQLNYGSVNQFCPQVAKSIYQRYNPSSILDFSAGWGGRALGAMALNIPYIGIDSNSLLEPCYNALRQYDPMVELQMIFQPSESVDFSKFTYDMVFTSPPYYIQEIYPEMPSYPTLQDFLDIFLRPTTLKAWEHLQSGGHMALNLPDWLYDRLALDIPLLERVPMPYNGRSGAIRHEWVYVWRKP